MAFDLDRASTVSFHFHFLFSLTQVRVQFSFFGVEVSIDNPVIRILTKRNKKF